MRRAESVRGFYDNDHHMGGATAHYHATKERALWVRVLAGAIFDACKDPREGEAWVGRYMTQDFRELCELAGFDPDYVWRGCRDLLDTKDPKLLAERAYSMRSMFYAGTRGTPKKREDSVSAAPAPKGKVLDRTADTPNCNPKPPKGT